MREPGVVKARVRCAEAAPGLAAHVYSARSVGRSGVGEVPAARPELLDPSLVLEDMAELYDLKESEPEKYKELMEEWRKFSNEINVQIAIPSED